MRPMHESTNGQFICLDPDTGPFTEVNLEINAYLSKMDASFDGLTSDLSNCDSLTCIHLLIKRVNIRLLLERAYVVFTACLIHFLWT